MNVFCSALYFPFSLGLHLTLLEKPIEVVSSCEMTWFLLVAHVNVLEGEYAYVYFGS